MELVRALYNLDNTYALLGNNELAVEKRNEAIVKVLIVKREFEDFFDEA